MTQNLEFRTKHRVVGLVKAPSASTTVVFAESEAFDPDFLYAVKVRDVERSRHAVEVTERTATGFTFVSVPGHVYRYEAVGY